MDKTEPAGHQKDQQKLDRLRAGVILRAYVQGWPAIDLRAVTVETGSESWASFLKAAGVDELAAALAELNKHRCARLAVVWARLHLVQRRLEGPRRARNRKVITPAHS